MRLIPALCHSCPLISIRRIRNVFAHTYRAAAALVILGVFLSGCGGGGGGGGGEPPPAGPVISQFTSDRSAYYVGESARLTAVFANGTGVLQPDDIPVQSGQPVTISDLTRPIRYKLVVTNGAQSVSRDLDLNVSYRERTRAIEMPFARAEHAAAQAVGRVSQQRIGMIEFPPYPDPRNAPKSPWFHVGPGAGMSMIPTESFKEVSSRVTQGEGISSIAATEDNIVLFLVSAILYCQ